jgi:hypothetical protein
MTLVLPNRLHASPDRRRGAWLGVVGEGAARAGVGLAVLVRPESLPRALGVDAVSARRMAWVVRLFAARDAALGVGAVHAVLTRRPTGPWLVAQAFVDAVDAAALMVAVRARHVSPARGLAAGVVAATATVAGLVAARRAGEAPPGR